MENLVFLATEHSSHQGFNLGNMAINIVAVLILLVLLEKNLLGTNLLIC